jgi:uncharacterized protein YebE (UPF0316 family)
LKFIITFTILSIINVVFSTIRSIATIKGGKNIASIISGGYFAFYNVMLIYTVADFSIWQKCLITFCCNVVGVWAVKWGEEKTRKTQLWKVEATVPIEKAQDLKIAAELLDLSFNYVDIKKYWVFNFYCPDKYSSKYVKQLLDQYNAKYFVSESRKM